MVSPPLEGLEELKVSTLKTDDGMGWVAGLLRAIFEEKDSWMIQHITLSRIPCDDGWLWCHERSGAYTVKSSYRNQQGTRISPRHPTITVNWLAMNVSGKVRILIWHVCSNLLPTMQVLFRRRITKTDRCSCNTHNF